MNGDPKYLRLDDVPDVPCACTPETCTAPNCPVLSLDEIPDLSERELRVRSMATGEFVASAGNSVPPEQPGAIDYTEYAPFIGLTHAEVLKMEFDAERFLIDDLIPFGAVGTIAGVPETHKSWLAHAIAVRVARGEGNVLGRTVTHGGPVGYWWQDDSTREEAERVKLFERVHANPEDLPLRWFLNEGLRLPRDLGRLEDAIGRHGLVLALLDSFYNVLDPELERQGDGAEQVVALLKQEITDKTGCTVLIVDHMPWATDSNRQRLRAYGGVFKNAATRFGIYIDAPGKKLHLEARGNNMRGIPKTHAEWDPDTLELRLIDTDDQAVSGEEYEQRIVDYLTANPWPNSGELEQADGMGRGTEHRAARDRLEASGRIHSKTSRELGRIGRAKHWNLTSHAGSTPSGLPGTDLDAASSVHPSRVSIGTEYGTDVPDPDEVERLLRDHADIAKGTE
jgi:hypothetical protein